ncbi:MULTISPECIES: hypothetical protein [Actinosynnema]|uniref:hypothetical protein n=1 Tax=Actinosynnema TaxID=40566 RepID=UPI0020A3DF56|nr:hypothetical protein [Actinosynnema pretiosum]MCP2097127.1 hypothetical protein [Actinosynnema pretiosum]
MAAHRASRALAVLLLLPALALAPSAAGAPAPEPPPDPAPPSASAGIVVNYRVDGTNRVAKFGSDLTIGPGSLSAEIDLLAGSITGQLELPPSDGYFLSFGFVPTTSRVDLIPVNPVRGTIKEGQVTATALITIRLGDVVVGGQPLDVGPDCRTAEPAVLELSGPFDLTAIPMEAVFTIPPFTGCQGAERLDPLLTGLVSGPGNGVELTLTAKL